MKTTRTPWKRTIGARAAVRRLFPMLLLFLSLVTGCPYDLPLFGDCGAELLIEGRVVDAITLEPATDVFIGIRAERDGKVIRLSLPTTDSGEATNPPPEADGGFSFYIDSRLGVCPPTFTVPEPDIVTLLIVRGTCTEEIVLDISEGSADHTLEEAGGLRTTTFILRNPVLVSPCVE